MEVSSRNEVSYLLGKLQEECAEVVVEVSKALCFGLDEQYTPDHPTNKGRIENEMKDLITIAKLLEEHFDFNFGLDEEDLDYEINKINKIQHYCNLSTKLGLLHEEG